MLVYGYINNEGCLVDTGLTAKGAKKVATIVGAKQVGYRVGYNATITHTKQGLHWRPVSLIEGKIMTYKTAKMKLGAEVIVKDEFPRMARVTFTKYNCTRWVNKKSLHTI